MKDLTPKEKAKELVEQLCIEIHNEVPALQSEYFKLCIYKAAKQCAIIAVDEIINSSPSLPILGDGGTYGEDIELSTEYWQEVKSEIEKL